MATAAPPASRRTAGAARTRQRRRSRAWVVLGAAAILIGSVLGMLLPQTPLNSYTISVAYSMAFFVAVAQAWNLMSGFTGYISFAHGALVGVGGYAAVLAINNGWSFIGSVLAGAMAATVASVLIGLPSLRLRGIAFAFATIFFQAIALIVAEKAVSITGGSQGLASVEIMPIDDLLVAMAAIAGAATLVVHLLRASRLGLRLLAIREDETAARVIGIPTVRLKLGAFAVSAAFTGAAGAVHAFFLATLFPLSVFDISTSIDPLVVALLGGSASAFGPVVTGAVYALSQESLQHLGSELQLSLLGGLLVLVVLFARDGLAGILTRLRDAIRARRRGRSD
ncbi:MAG: branched-chain amino acid ABC transporter permease [Nocardioidaceae bacterium]